jgi:outer membrane protein assembly factor BamB
MVSVVVYVVFFRGHDNGVPLWRNQRQSASMINQGDSVVLEAEGLDAVSLDKASLATNESGVWRNITGYTHLWTQEIVHGFDNFATATYKDGVLYAPSKDDNQVYAINASDGSIVWNRTIRQCDASPYVDGDVLYVGECFGPYDEYIPSPKAMALNRTTGEEIWHFVEPDNYAWVGSPLVYGDYVYYTTYGSGVYALNKTNGQPIWNRPEIGSVVCSVAFDAGVVFVSSHNPSGQYALNASTGEYVWHRDYGSSWDASPVVSDGMIVQVIYNATAGMRSTLVLNESDGGLLRSFHGKGACSTPLVRNGEVFIPDESFGDQRIYVFDLLTGEELWHSVQLHDGYYQDQSYCSPAASGGAIYYQSMNGTFYVINETDGEVLWSYVLGGLGFGSPSIGDGCVFITNDFSLYAFRIGSGSDFWPMFCNNGFHQSVSANGVEHVELPLMEPKSFAGCSNVWVVAMFVWRNETAVDVSIAWRIYFFDDSGNTGATDVMVFHVGT